MSDNSRRGWGWSYANTPAATSNDSPGISKRGDPYLRMLLIQLARSDVYRCSAKTDPRRDGSQTSRKGWAQRRHVRCANKNARIIWALLAKDEGTGKRPRQIRFYKIAAKMME
jgi:Transposase IS116/IS110/IS902 family